VLHYIAGEEAS